MKAVRSYKTYMNSSCMIYKKLISVDLLLFGCRDIFLFGFVFSSGKTSCTFFTLNKPVNVQRWVNVKKSLSFTLLRFTFI